MSAAASALPAPEVTLAVRDLSKRFGGTQALARVDLTVMRGEIHALLGANGAGKSTLIKILAGVHRADGGQVTLAGVPFDAAARHRISFVHQDLALIGSMSVGENIAMTAGYPRRARLIDWGGVNRRAADAFERLGCVIPLNRKITELGQAERSIVAIARALIDRADLLVLDEPTASLPEADVARLFAVLERLRQDRVSILYVTHRLDEVFKMADAATVFRDGRTVAVYRPLSLTADQLVTDIVGRQTARHISSAHGGAGKPMLAVENLAVGDVGPVSFTVAPGEILGLAGLRGQGHETVGRAVAGVEPATAGALRLGDRRLAFGAPRDAIAAGIGFATGKRAEEGMAPTLSVRENLFLNPQNFGRGNWNFSGATAEAARARRILARFDVRPADPNRDISTLSGGNQQKVVLARWAGQHYKLLVLEDPTIGVDFGAKAEIYRLLAEDAAAGMACIIVSSDLDELVQLCHRVLVFNRGRISAELRRDRLTLEALTAEVGGAGAERHLHSEETVP